MERVCLKNGYIIDGSGEKGFIGDVLIENSLIKAVSKESLDVDCPTIDCTGLAISPGFIDSHSHQDMYVIEDNDLLFTEPFIRQGITTYVAGNCGHGPAGVMKDSPHIETGHTTDQESAGPGKKFWNTYAEYFDFLRKKGLRQNLALLASHGTALTSVAGLMPETENSPEDKQKVIEILAEGIDSGCKGISFGLGYRPGSHIPDTEVREISELCIKRNKIIAFHSRVLGSSAADLYGDDFSTPHNVRWHKEFLELFRDSGARLQLSHLLFVGRKAWPSYDPMFEMLDDMIENAGIDLWFDLYPYIQGITSIAIRMPKFFYDNIPEIYENKSMWPELEAEIVKYGSGRGIELGDVMLCDGMDTELDKYRGMYLDEICEARDMSQENYIWIYIREQMALQKYI